MQGLVDPDLAVKLEAPQMKLLCGSVLGFRV